MIFTARSALLMAQMKLDQWKHPDDILGIQEGKFRELISYARSNVPYYRPILEKTDLRGLEDLSLLPVLKKDVLRERTADLISRRFSRNSLECMTTSGSSGLPLAFYIDKGEAIHRSAMVAFSVAEAGLGPFERFVFVTYDHLKHNAPVRFYWPISISMFDTEEKVLGSIRNHGVRTLQSYPSVLALLAKKNIELDFGIRLKKVISGAETLLPGTRQLIRRSFGCEVRNIYGAIEVSRIAWECEEGSMHLTSDSMIAEVVDEKDQVLPEGKRGRLLITPIFQRAMPLIRYDLGDIASLGSYCPCGRGTKILKSIEGRQTAMLAMKSGRLCNSLALDIYIRHFPGILAFRGFQKRPGELLLRIVGSHELREADLTLLKEKLESTFAEPLDIGIEVVDRLPEAGYKLNCMESKVNADP
jgi:phenylacetate-CoA ligase